VDRLVKYEQNQIADINMDIAAIYEWIASLELPDSKAKPESIDHLYKMTARLTVRQVEHVQAIQQHRSVQFASKQNKSKTPSQDVRKREQEHKESDNIQQMTIPDPVVSQIVLQEPVVTHDRFGNPLSACGLPLTLWNPTIHTTGNRLNCPTHPLPTSNGGYHGGGDDDDDGDDYYGGGGCRRSERNPPPNSCHASCPFDDPVDPGKEGKENAFRRQMVSLTLYYPPPTRFPMASQVAWLSNSIDGPYDGKLDRLTKGSFQLLNHSPSSFWVFYASI
jgi:hypothetical protein